MTAPRASGGRRGPLVGTRVVELAGIGPTPFAATMLADMGAEVIRVERTVEGTSLSGARGRYAMNRGRRSIALDLTVERGVEVLLRLVDRSDALLEGSRPGVAERLGFGPDECLARNGRLVYGRMTGWGQVGPRSRQAGHDINYIAMAGALGLVGRKGEVPVPPVNLLGDYAGGAMFLAFGVVCGLLESSTSGRGQIVDAAMVDGSAMLTLVFHAMRAQGLWHDERGVNLLDTGAHYYDVYETSDGRFVSVGALEPKFYARLIDLLGLSDEIPSQAPEHWTTSHEVLARRFKEHDLAHWSALFDGTDACVAPVLTLEEAASHPDNAARDVFVQVDGVVQPAPAPRFSRTPGAVSGPPPLAGEHSNEILEELGFDDEQRSCLLRDQVVA